MTSDTPEYVLVPDGDGGLRMTRVDAADASAWDTAPGPLDPNTSNPAAPAVSSPDGTRVRAVALGVCLMGIVLGVALFRPAHHARPDLPPAQGITVVRNAPYPLPAMAAITPGAGVSVGPANALPAAAVLAPSAVARTSAIPAPTPAILAKVAPASGSDRLAQVEPGRVSALSADRRGSLAAAEAPEADENSCTGSVSDRLVCADSELGDFDREMHQDLREAARAGVSLEDLRAGQADFARRREAAAHRSPDAVAEVYDRRIVELERLIADAPR